MPDVSSLYPQPPQPNQQNNSLLNNPGQAIGLMQGLQNLQIQQQQAPALMQQPQAGLNIQRQELARQQAEFDAQMRRNYSNHWGSWLTNLGHEPSETEIRSHASNASQDFGGARADINAQIAKDVLAQKNRQAYGKTLNAQGLTPGEFSQRTESGYDPKTGGRTTAPLGNVTAQGDVVSQPPLSAAASAQELANDRGRMANYRQEISPWENAYTALKALGPGGTAPGAEGRADAKAFLYGIAPNLVPDYMKEDVKNFETLRKHLTNATQIQASNLTPHTNAGLTESVTGNPNTKITDMTNEQLIRYRIGMRRLEQAQMFHAEKQGGDVGYSHEKGRVAQDWNLHAFNIDTASPEELDKLKNLKGKALDDFNRSLRAAYDAKVLTRPGQ